MNSLAHESNRKYSQSSPGSFLKSIDPNINNLEMNNATNGLPQGITAEDLLSLQLDDGVDPNNDGRNGVLLIDEKEKLRLNSEDTFVKALKIDPGKKVKVVSIFGNTGEGKSYTMNQVFFNGEEVFKTSASQISCTLGVWAKYDPNLNVICIDTEGLLGITKHENQRTRLLLKVLAVSDIVIYRTRAERIPKDLFTFLGGASSVYAKHFSSAFKKLMEKRSDGDKTSAGLGPGLIIFHETRHTETLEDLQDVNNSAEDLLRQRFAELGLNCDAFSFMKYIGIRTTVNEETSFNHLKVEIHKQLESTELRSARDPKVVCSMLRSLNEQFRSPLSESNHEQYIAQFFTCQEKCQSCKAGCRLSMGHTEKEPHLSDRPCQFQHQYQNCVFLCKKCLLKGHKIIVKPSYQTTRDNSWASYFNYVWSGYVIECPACGEIYRSRKHWYGNKNPEESAVQLEVVHIWQGEGILFGTMNPAQKMVDGVSVITDVVSSVSAQPAKMITDWYNDKIAPSYWRPNHEINDCHQCRVSFTLSNQNRMAPSKHHCRSCGEGFCENCSSKRCKVPQRGWTDEPVRVCDACYDELEGRGDSLLEGLTEEQSTEVRARYISETVVNSMSAVKTVWNRSKDLIKENARPSYWTPDNECKECILCKEVFGPQLALHHCRDCGKGVCDYCSKSRKAVPLKGWTTPVRVCNACR